MNHVYAPENFAEIAPFLRDPDLAKHKFFDDQTAQARIEKIAELTKRHRPSQQVTSVQVKVLRMTEQLEDGTVLREVEIRVLGGMLDFKGKRYTLAEFRAAFASDRFLRFVADSLATTPGLALK